MENNWQFPAKQDHLRRKNKIIQKMKKENYISRFVAIILNLPFCILRNKYQHAFSYRCGMQPAILGF
jgi:hypothetical protein